MVVAHDVEGRTGDRPYHSPLRQQRAADTRQRIARAAHELFAEHGFAGTTVASIAERAGVAAPTVYATFGSKGAVARAVLMQMEDDADRAGWARRVAEEQDPHRKLMAFAAWTTALFSSSKAVIAAVHGAAENPVIKELRDAGNQQRREGLRGLISSLADRTGTPSPTSMPSALSGRWPPSTDRPKSRERRRDRLRVTSRRRSRPGAGLRTASLLRTTGCSRRARVPVPRGRDASGAARRSGRAMSCPCTRRSASGSSGLLMGARRVCPALCRSWSTSSVGENCCACLRAPSAVIRSKSPRAAIAPLTTSHQPSRVVRVRWAATSWTVHLEQSESERRPASSMSCRKSQSPRRSSRMASARSN